VFTRAPSPPSDALLWIHLDERKVAWGAPIACVRNSCAGKPLQGAVLSFFEEGDEPRTAIESPVPSRQPRRRATRGRRPPDDRTVLARRAGAIGVAIVVIAILFFGIRAYLSSEATQALKNYNSNVTTLIEGEQTGVAQPLFASLATAPGTAGQLNLTQLQSAIYQDYVTANQDAQTAAAWSVPSAVAGAQQDLLLVLDLRAEAIDKVSQQIDLVLQNDSMSAIETIAGAMNMINASDVIYSVRVQPLIEQALAKDGIQVAGTGAGGVSLGGEQVISSTFLPNPSWTVAGYVQGRLVGSTSPQLGGSLGVGTHGHKLVGVMAGSTELLPGQLNTVPWTKDLNYTVSFENDGENDEFGVITKLSLTSASTSPQNTEIGTRETMPGQTYQSTLTFGTYVPPPNTPLRLTATIVPVVGEHDISNNTLTYIVEFTGS
jgi:hypothetical protein